MEEMEGGGRGDGGRRERGGEGGGALALACD
jgi:hypothetical protein